MTRRARFCDQCGAGLEWPRTETPRADVDPVEAGDRRVVTALFADLVDYVRMIAEHDPEEVGARVRAALGRMADSIERLDGTREKFIGDAVFAVFGWPRAQDDDPVRGDGRTCDLVRLDREGIAVIDLPGLVSASRR